MPPTDLVSDDYRTVLADLHSHVREARMQAQRRVNTALTQLY